MRIWYFNHYAGGPGIGRGFRAFNLAKCWSAMGHEAVIHTASFHPLLDKEEVLPPEFSVENVRYRTFPAPRYRGNGLGRMRNMFAFAWGMLVDGRLRQEKPDVIIASSPHPYAIVSAHFLARLHKCPLLFEVRDLWPLSLVDLGIAPKYHPIILVTALVEWYAHKVSDRVVSLLPHASSYMQRHGMAHDKFVYIPNGMDDVSDIDLLEPKTEAGAAVVAAIKAASSAGKLTVIYAGAHGQPNGLDVLLEAAGQFKQQEKSDDFAFFLIGKGEIRDQLIAQAQQRGLGSVHFYEAMPKSDALAAIAASDVGFISLKGDGEVFKYGVSPNKLWDYMAMAKPILMAINAGNDPVGEARAGFKADPRDAADVVRKLQALKDLSAEERQTLGQNGRAYAFANHSYDVLGTRYINVIEDARRNMR